MPRVFLSYSHEEPEHGKWVMDLATSLRRNGVDAYLDRWDLIPGQDITLFMESQIRDSDFVILVCTPKYSEKSNAPQGGVGYEKNIISAEMLQASDLRPKFIPVLREGTYDDALPNYLGSKYAIDFRESRDQNDALKELLRAIYKQLHPEKPPLGPSPFKGTTRPILIDNVDVQSTPVIFQQDQDIDIWEKEALGRFLYLREKRLIRGNPFESGYWQSSFVLFSRPDVNNLKVFLEKLRTSETGRTGWDIGWVPTRAEIAPYPFKNGIEVWLAEDGDEGPEHSDFWRAEPTGRFSLFRGYQEDEEGFGERKNLSKRIIDCSLFLWRVSELLLYIESFSNQMSVGDSKAIVKLTWKGLEGRIIRDSKKFARLYDNHKCRQDVISSIYEIASCSKIKRNLIRDVHSITTPLFESFNFFSVTEEEIKDHIKELFDSEKEGV